MSYPIRPVVPMEPTKKPTPEEEVLKDTYQKLRLDGYDLEELLAVIADPRLGWSDYDQKRLDKGIVLLKVGMKYLKKTLKGHGFRELKPAVRVHA